MFKRFDEKYNNHYNTFTGESSWTTYSSVDYKKSFDPTVFVKKEVCVNHVPKCMGINLRHLVIEYKGKNNQKLDGNCE